MGYYKIKNEVVELESKWGSGTFELKNDGKTDIFLNVNNGYQVIVGIGCIVTMGGISNLSINTINGEANAIIQGLEQVINKINRKLLLFKK